MNHLAHLEAVRTGPRRNAEPGRYYLRLQHVLAIIGMIALTPHVHAQGTPVRDRWYLELEVVSPNAARLDSIARTVTLQLTADSIHFENQPGNVYRGVRRGDSVEVLWGPTPAATTGRRLKGRIVAPGLISGTWMGSGGNGGGWRATLDRPSRAARAIRYVPPREHETWSSRNPPGMRAVPGDTITMRTGSHTPAPIYIEGAFPGDAIEVELLRVRSVRLDARGVGDLIPDRFLSPYNRRLTGELSYSETAWRIDTVRRVAAWTDSLGRTLEVPLKPMLGSIGVAPGGDEAVARHKEGVFGGNLDYNRIVEGSRVVLPVFATGALLSVGDAHAAQGDGELAGIGLETSVEVTFLVSVVRNAAPPAPRIIDSEFLMALGTAGTLDEALRIANTNLATWLQQDYELPLRALTAVLGAALVIDVANVWDDHVTVAAKVPRRVLLPFRRQ